MSPLGIPSIRYQSWGHFKASLFDELDSSGQLPIDRYLFRGHADSGWRLESSFDRAFPAVDDPEQAFRGLLAHFKEGCDGEVPKDVLEDEARLIALAQHSGLPTRLLDWSESPYVAAFFAFGPRIMEASLSADVAVWVLDTDSPMWHGDHGVDVVRVPAGANIRMRNQSGRFTLTRAGARSLEEAVATAALSPSPLTQLLLPAEEARVALTDLALMGLSHARLMPGLDGVAQAAYMRVVLEQQNIYSHGPS